MVDQCLASLIYHQDKVLEQLDANHLARSISIFHESSVRATLAPHTQMVHSWETTKALTGISPHIKMMVDMMSVKQQQSEIVEKVFNKVMDGLTGYSDERNIGRGELTEARVNSMVSNFVRDHFSECQTQLQSTLATIGAVTNNGQDQQIEKNVDGVDTTEDQERATYPLRVPPEGIFSRVPQDFEWPNAGLSDLWVRWNIRDTARGIPPCRVLHTKDLT
jgi:hypothetical protein